MKSKFVCALIALTAATAQAQDTAAERTIGLKLAAEMAAAAVEDCSSKGYNTVAVVVDRSGYMKALMRAENARPHAIDIAIRKAHTAAMLGYETRILSENIGKGVTPASITSLPILIGKPPSSEVKPGVLVIDAGVTPLPMFSDRMRVS